MRRPTPLPEQFAGTPFSVGAATGAGVSRERLRRGDLMSPFHGTRDHTAAIDIEEQCRQFLPIMPSDAAFSHATAARLWNLPLPVTSGVGGLDVSVPSGRRLIRARGIIGHELRWDADDLTVLGGLVLTTPARTFCDLASVLRLEQLVAMGDRILWRKAPLASRSALDSAVRDHSARRGRPNLRAALPLLSDRSDSPPESIIRVRLIEAGLPEPRPNFVVRRPDGRFVAQVDLAFPDFKMAVEYEGDHHRTDVLQWRKDLGRVPALEDISWHVTRASGADLQTSATLIAHLSRRLSERGWPGV